MQTSALDFNVGAIVLARCFPELVMGAYVDVTRFENGGFVPKHPRRSSGRRNARAINMRFLRWLVFLLPLGLTGQTVRVDLSPPIQEPGRTIALIQLLSQPGAQPAALQWTLLGATNSVQIEAGDPAVSAKKQITCGAYVKRQMTCLLWGRNRNVIHDGIVAKVIVPGTGFHMRLVRLSAASADGQSLPVQPSSESGEKAVSSLPRFSATDAGITLLAIFVAIFLVRRLLAGRSVSKQLRASGRSGSPQ